MKKLTLMAVSAAALLFAQGAKAQTNLQIFYDFGPDRQHVTTTLEGFYNDNWGNTFFFIDHDFGKDANGKVFSPSGTYFEIARCLNFWQNSALAPLSLQVEYNGGVYNGYGINNAFLTGVDYFVHNADFSNTFNFKLLGKTFSKGVTSDIPLQFTFVWGCDDFCKAPGLRFSGFLDIWGERFDGKQSFVLISEPQLWYNVGRWFKCPNLHIGTEIEFSYNFNSGTPGSGFMCNPCLGVKWCFD